MIYRFGPCLLDTARHEFRRDGTPVPLEPQVFDLLHLFVSQPGVLVDRDRMIETVWQGRIVSEATISSRIASVRRAIGDDGHAQSLLRTLPRRGFRFVGAVTEHQPDDADHAAPRSDSQGQSIRMTTSADGTPIAFAVTGAGPPLMRAGHFLTHLEMDWESAVFRPMLDRLGTAHTVVRYDQRGTGLSDPAPASLSLECLVDDLQAVADAAGLDRFPIFALSQGVPVALAFAARCPERVSALVLYGGYAQGRGIRKGAEEQQNAEAMLTMIRQGWGRAGGAFAAAFATVYMPDASLDQREQMSRTQLASATPENAVALRRAVDLFDVTGIMGSVTAPTLVIHADEDAVHPIAQARLIAAGVPGARLHVLHSRNHIPVPQDPVWPDLLKSVLSFVRQAD